MTVAIDTGNVQSSDANAFLGGAYSVSMNVTCGASDNCLAVLIGASGGATSYPTYTSLQYNGVALSFLSGSSSQLLNANYFSTYIYYLMAPPTGASYALNVIWTVGQGGAIAVPMSGVNSTTPFGTPILASSSANNSAAVTATGASASGLYLGVAFNAIATMVASGANQTNLAALNAFNTNTSVTGDYVPGVDAGAFSWTGSGTQWQNGWVATGVPVNAVASPPGAGSLVLSGNQPGLVRGTVLTPNTAKVRDAIRQLGRAIFLPSRSPLIRV